MAAYVIVKKKADGLELLRLLAPKLGEKVLNAVRTTAFGEAILTRREGDGSEVTLADDDLLAAGVYYIEAASPGTRSFQLFCQCSVGLAFKAQV
jgi:hypothetical protein